MEGNTAQESVAAWLQQVEQRHSTGNSSVQTVAKLVAQRMIEIDKVKDVHIPSRSLASSGLAMKTTARALSTLVDDGLLVATNGKHGRAKAYSLRLNKKLNGKSDTYDKSICVANAELASSRTNDVYLALLKTDELVDLFHREEYGETALRIISALFWGDSVTIQQVMETTGLSERTCRDKLKKLSRAGIVSPKRQSRLNVYDLNCGWADVLHTLSNGSVAKGRARKLTSDYDVERLLFHLPFKNRTFSSEDTDTLADLFASAVRQHASLQVRGMDRIGVAIIFAIVDSNDIQNIKPSLTADRVAPFVDAGLLTQVDNETYSMNVEACIGMVKGATSLADWRRWAGHVSSNRDIDKYCEREYRQDRARFEAATARVAEYDAVAVAATPKQPRIQKKLRASQFMARSQVFNDLRVRLHAN